MGFAFGRMHGRIRETRVGITVANTGFGSCFYIFYYFSVRMGASERILARFPDFSVVSLMKMEALQRRLIGDQTAKAVLICLQSPLRHLGDAG